MGYAPGLAGMIGVLEVLNMILDARQDLAQLGHGLRKADGAQREMQQSQAEHGFRFHGDHSHDLKTMGHSALSLFVFAPQILYSFLRMIERDSRRS